MKLYTFNMDPYHSGSVFAGNIPKGQDVYLKILVYKNGKPSVDVVEKDEVFYPEFAVYAKSEQENKMTVYRVPNSTNEDDLIDLDIYSQSDAQSMFEDGSETEEDVSGERWIVLKLTYENFKKFEKDSESKFFIPILGPEKTDEQPVKQRLTWIKVALTAGRVGIPEIENGGGGGDIPTDPTFSSIKVGNPENPNFEVDRSGNLTAGTGEFENDLLVGGQQVATMQDIPEKSATAPKVLPDYLYSLEFDNDYADVGKAWREQNFETIDIGGCSSVRKNNWVGRNYDYTYSDAATFVIKLPNRVVGGGTKYGSVGVATLGSHLTKSMIESGEYTDLYKVLPGMTTDGINEKGLQAAIHLVPSDTTKDAGWTGNSMDAFGAVRYVLDTFDNAESAADWLASNVYLPDKYVTETGYSVQYIVSGYNQNTYIVQDGVVYDYGETTGALTNYRLYNSGSLTPEFNRAVIGTYDPYGQGVERMGLIQTGIETLYTSDDISLLMEQLYFTNAYSPVTSNPWYSEFVSKESERTLLSPDSDFTAPLAIGRLAYNVRDRFNPSHVEYEGETYDVTTWQTVHTVIYDLESKTLTVRVQEGDEEYTFKCASIPTKTSDLTNDSGFITNSVKGQTFSVQSTDGSVNYFRANSTGVFFNGKQVATVDQIKSQYYQFDTTADLSTAVFDPNTVYVVETGTTTPATWHIDLNVTQTDYPTTAVMDCVLLVEDLTQIPTSITVGISNGAVPRFFGDTFDVIDAANVPYLITFTVLNWDEYAANVFVKIQKQES